MDCKSIPEHNRSGDLADGENVVVPAAVEGGGLGVGDEDPIDAVAGLEALEVCELEGGPAGLGKTLVVPDGAESGDFGDDGCIFQGVGERASLSQCAEAVVVLAWGVEAKSWRWAKNMAPLTMRRKIAQRRMRALKR